jgi:hypothetical protein
MIEYFVQSIGRIIGVFKLLLTCKTIGVNVHIDIHRILYPLLPAVRLGLRKKEQKENNY